MPPVLFLTLAWVGHLAPVVPFALCLWKEFREGVPWEAKVIVMAMYVSVIADTLGMQLNREGLPNAWLTYWYVPAQYGLLAVVVARRRAVRTMGVILIAELALVSLSLGWPSFTQPEIAVQFVGGSYVAWLAWRAEGLKPYRSTVMLYGAGLAPIMLAELVVPRSEPLWAYLWGGQQLVRITAMGLLARAIIAPPRSLRLEVTRGGNRRVDEDRPGRRPARLGARPAHPSGPGHVVATGTER